MLLLRPGLALPLLLGLASAAAEDPLASLPPPEKGAVRLYLVRHGQALSNLEPAPDLPAERLDHLTELGQKQAERAGQALGGRSISAILTSPASRARETAERMASVLGLPPPQVEPRLRPLRLGRGADGRALDWDDRAASWKAGRDPVPAGGESMEQLGDRVADLAAALARAHGAGGIVLVAHGEVIGAYLGRLRGTPPAKRYPPALANASISVVEVGRDGRARVLLANVQAP
jgi:probable phosphoglycerate mutase